MSPKQTLTHAPVLLEEALAFLAVQPGGRYIDCTLGGAGHARAIIEAAAPGGLLLGIDADPAAIERSRRALAPYDDSLKLVEANFRQLESVCRRNSFVPVHGVLFDLGISSYQLADAGRGFGFQVEAPLDMRISPSQKLTAADIVNDYEEAHLADLIYRFGEEPASRRIARAVVRARPLRTTTELASVIAGAAGGRHGRIHPATRTFQALRIAVNDELSALSEGLEQAVRVLGSGGRLVVISFHSLEDRIVKQLMQRESRDCICPPEQPSCVCGHRATLRVLTRHPVRPGPDEVRANPRSRSARLRAAERLSANAGQVGEG